MGRDARGRPPCCRAAGAHHGRDGRRRDAARRRTRARAHGRHPLSLPPGQRLRLRDRLPRAGRRLRARARRGRAASCSSSARTTRSAPSGSGRAPASTAPSSATAPTRAYPLDELEKVLPRFLEKAPHVYHSVLRDDPLAAAPARAHPRARRPAGRARARGPTAHPRAGRHPARDAAPQGARRARPHARARSPSPARRTARRCATARPGMTEYEIEALVDFTFRRRGATGPAYPSIVASGAERDRAPLHRATTAHSATDELLPHRRRRRARAATAPT